MLDLFDSPALISGTPVALTDGDVVLYRSFFPLCDADRYLSALLSDIRWKQEKIHIYGKQHDLPRLTAWYGDPGKTYRYSGINVTPSPWTDILSEIKARVEEVSGVRFNSVLLNRYRSGSDSVAWHSDDEPELGLEPVIASVSLGEERGFQMKHKRDSAKKLVIPLSHGSLLVMRGRTQECWLHQIAKSSRELSQRVNLTFRVIRPA